MSYIQDSKGAKGIVQEQPVEEQGQVAAGEEAGAVPAQTGDLGLPQSSDRVSTFREGQIEQAPDHGFKAGMSKLFAPIHRGLDALVADLMAVGDAMKRKPIDPIDVVVIGAYQALDEASEGSPLSPEREAEFIEEAIKKMS